MGFAFDKMEGLAYSMMTEFQQMKHYAEETYEESVSPKVKMAEKMKEWKEHMQTFPNTLKS